MAMTMSLMIGMFLGSIPWLLAWARLHAQQLSCRDVKSPRKICSRI